MITLKQRMELNRAKTDAKKVALWTEYGFTPEEAKAMVKGGMSRGSGYWQTGNVPWYQAISKEHAEKLNMVTSPNFQEAQWIE